MLKNKKQKSHFSFQQHSTRVLCCALHFQVSSFQVEGKWRLGVQSSVVLKIINPHTQKELDFQDAYSTCNRRISPALGFIIVDRKTRPQDWPALDHMTTLVRVGRHWEWQSHQSHMGGSTVLAQEEAVRQMSYVYHNK